MGKKYGARNALKGTVTRVTKGDVMSQVTFKVSSPGSMSSVITTESLEELALKKGDKVELIIKAIHVLPVKDI